MWSVQHYQDPHGNRPAHTWGEAVARADDDFADDDEFTGTLAAPASAKEAA